MSRILLWGAGYYADYVYSKINIKQNFISSKAALISSFNIKYHLLITTGSLSYFPTL